MEKSLNYYLSCFVISLLVCCFGCQTNENFYKKQFTEEEKLKQAEMLLSGMGYRYYYQGTVGELCLVEEAAKYNEEHPEVWRELGIPYLKRGIAAGFYEPYKKCIEQDAVTWQGYRGYCYLYFYNDYERALDDFNALDTLTPDFVDHPQAQSVDFMRAICYLKMEKPAKALDFINRHMATETAAVGEDYIDAITFVVKGKVLEKMNRIEEAQANYEKGIQVHERQADLKYNLAKLLHEKGMDSKALQLLSEAKEDYAIGYFNNRGYVEEFYQVYRADFEDLKNSIGHRS